MSAALTINSDSFVIFTQICNKTPQALMCADSKDYNRYGYSLVKAVKILPFLQRAWI